MERRTSIWWLGLFWIPVVAVVLGLMVGCAGVARNATGALEAPSKVELRRLVAQTLDVDSPFDSFAGQSSEAQSVAAAFRPVLADVTARECRAVASESMDCTLEIVLQFPAMGGRQSHTTWERRLRHTQGAWQIVVQTP